MIDYAAHRAKLQAAIERRRQAERAKLEPEDKPRCEHSFSKSKQTLPVERPDIVRAVETGTTYKGGRAYFIVLACEVCHEKRAIDYVVER